MYRTVAALFAFSLVFATVPIAQASHGTVAGCSTQCTPKAGDVNGPDPKTGEETVKTILYGHFQDILNRAPLNAQLPDPQEPNLNRGYLMPVVATNNGVNRDLDVKFENNWFYMYSSAGFVEIVEGVWRVHQEPGLAEDLKIASDTITLYFYLSANPVPNGDSDQFPGDTLKLDVMPQVGVYARIESGRHPFSANSDIIAETDPILCDAGAACRVNVITLPNEPDIYELAVPLKIKIEPKEIKSVWSGAQGFIVSINPYQIKDGNGQGKDTQVMQADWRVRTGPSTPVRLIVDVANPMVTKAASLNVFNNNMFIRWSFVSPWGSYDIDDQSAQVYITGPTVPDPAKTGLKRPLIVKRSVDHDAHFKPVNATWKFDYQKADLEDGEYTVHMSVLNLQGTYKLEQTLTFTMAGGQPSDLQIIGGGFGDESEPEGDAKDDGGLLPGFEAGLLLASLAALAVALGRRRRK